jgi:hypothetical protein
MEILAKRWGIYGIYGKLTVYTQYKSCDEKRVPCKNEYNGKRHLNKKLREMAEMYGLDSRCISPHSLRSFGATAMAAAGMSEYDIKKMGG